ncbi:MAG: 7-cyano-7-deazaguanine synthase [Candidatus Pacebacteria bacterium]|nr:7-cyano-7-deazaguanine synthase [Candidatus Paceibacterota bacterium]
MKFFNNKGKIKLEDKENEDKKLLQSLDDIFLEKRDYIVKMPEEGECVLACLSGGQDSVANIGILLKEFKLNVYPFFINRGQSNYKHEKRSADYFNELYKKDFPELYHDYKEISVMTPGLEYKDLLREAKKKVTSIPLRNNISYPARNPIIFLTGMEYAYSLMAEGVNIKTMFASHVSSDGSYHCSQTWTRTMNLLICQILNDWEWQFISLPIETAFGNYFDKDVYIKWAHENNIPLYKARTCVKKFDKHCGDCPPCWERRRKYKELGIEDLTEYLFEMSEKMPTYYDHEEEEKNIK